MRLVSYHGDGRKHREWTRVDPTPEPWTFSIAAGALVRESSGSTWASDYPVIAFFWPQRFYQVFLLLKSGGPEYYCNIITPPVYCAKDAATSAGPGIDVNSWRESSIEFSDLDLDVYVSRRKNGIDVKELDRDEFERRKSTYAKEWIAGAEAANAELISQAGRGVGPFSPATVARWRAYVLGKP